MGVLAFEAFWRSLSFAVNVRRRGRADNSGEIDAGATTTVGLRPPFMVAPSSVMFSVRTMGMSEIILPSRRV
jgi:hypothetical protein